jgi:hypothetical protein
MTQTHEERLIKQREYRIKNHERLVVQEREYYWAHKEEKAYYSKEYGRAFRAAHSEELKTRHAAYHAAHREEINAKHRAHYQDLRLEALEHYGSKCACCGETTFEFLSIDHINGGGNQHRKELGIKAGNKFVRWLKENNWPEGYQILCHNCNLSKGFYGECPHNKQISLVEMYYANKEQASARIG